MAAPARSPPRGGGRYGGPGSGAGRTQALEAPRGDLGRPRDRPRPRTRPGHQDLGGLDPRLAASLTPEQVLPEYPRLPPRAISAVLAYAGARAGSRPSRRAASATWPRCWMTDSHKARARPPGVGIALRRVAGRRLDRVRVRSVFFDTRPRWQRRGAGWHQLGIGGRERAVVIDVRAKGMAMAEENVVVVRFTEPSKAYQALSVLKECSAAGRIGLQSAAVVDARPKASCGFRRAPTTSASSAPRAGR